MADQPKTQHPRGLGCEDCECWHWLGGLMTRPDGSTFKTMGQCRRYAQNPNAGYLPPADQRWPATSGLDWCIELALKEADRG